MFRSPTSIPSLLALAVVALIGCGDKADNNTSANNGMTTGADMGACDAEACDMNGGELCGNSMRDEGEACDDGNTEDGDGCSATCSQIEPGFNCPTVGACVPGEGCTNAIVEEGETCDDGNFTDGDGCSAECQLEDGWRCNAAGEVCVAAGCGDGIAVGAEACDDQNMNDGDGCSASCEVEDGWVCIAGGDCIAQQCGDGIRAGDEACDDANTDGGDGCAADCTAVEPNFICPTAGQACQTTVVCGDRRVSPTEQCDDGNTAAGDGCDAFCQREAGWACRVPGAACRADMCGDGFAVGGEVCDDGGTDPNDGCSATCELEEGWACPPMQSCFQTTCGDGNKEGTEQCDDGNLRPFDGCSPTCTNEPQCSGGVCTPICGDGVILPGPTQEACDDGNTRDGDGCSSTCTIEDGWTCTIAPEPLPTSVTLSLVLRDFKGIQWYADNTTQYGHPDFNDPNDGNGNISFGIVATNLAANGKPELTYATADPNDPTGLPKAQARFTEWYDSASPWNIEEVASLTLTRPGNSTTFSYDSSNGWAPNSTNGFYPLDTIGWVGQGSEMLRTSDAGVNDGANHNFNFTTETRFFFQYAGDEILSFSGDDDLWVFIDGVLCLDIGGVHPARAATMNLADPTQEANATQRAIVENCKAHLESLVTANNPNPLVEAAIFHAERHTTASNFQLELTGFVKERSSCIETCGDGFVTIGEVCDDGVNDGSYNGCAMDCLGFGGYCGDASINGPEICDDGVDANDARYGGCNPDCTPAGLCGDGVVQPLNEVCDDAVNDGSYGSCSPDCQMRAARCGDGIVNGPEDCDEGLGGNLGNYNGCNPDCSFGPRCGDGIKHEGEQCDDGDADDYDGCTRVCEIPLL